MRKSRRRREGTTLAELMVSLMLMSILMLMVVGVVSPAAKTFVRMQRIQLGQLVLDNVEDEIRSQLQEAVDSIKICDIAEDESVLGKPGKSSGTVLEYVNTDSYVTMMSADGCEETAIIKGGQATGEKESADKGRLLMRYYWQKQAGTEEHAYEYSYQEEGKPVARAVQQVFADKYYMGNYLKLQFSFPDGVGNGDQVSYINIHAELYKDEARTDLLAAEDFVVELRYDAKRIDAVTAL